MSETKLPPQAIDYFSLDVPEEGFSASVVLATLEIFPDDLLESAAFTWQTLQSSLKSRRLTHEGLLASAYFGLMPIAGTHRRFTTDSEKYFKDRIRRSGAEDPRRPHRSRRDIKLEDENAAAAAWGLTGEEMKLLYKELDKAAISKGFASFREVFECNKDILAECIALGILEHSTDKYVYALGPRYLLHFAKFAAENNLTHVAFSVHLGWLLFLHADDHLVRGYALQPRTLRFGHGSFNRAIDYEHLRNPDHEDSSVFPVPLSVRTAVIELAASRFPGRPFELMPHPTHRRVNQIAGEAL